MRPIALFGLICTLLLAIAACQGPAPTQLVLVVTATPSQEADVAVSAESTQPQPSATIVEATATVPQPTNTPQPTATTDPRPTPVVNEILVAEQLFEDGRMFWIQPSNQIWVLTVTEQGQGDWRVYQDTFDENEDIEFDPEITPPEGYEQPRRGFGKLWRENPELRDALGWAVTPEFGYVTRYEYYAGMPTGEVDEQGTPIPAPGYHVLFSLYEEAFRFNEADQTWQLN